ncbi:hypothetical protein Tco_0007711 [Tanacetum coccineum]
MFRCQLWKKVVQPVSQFPRERFVAMLCREVSMGVRKLRGLGDCGDGNETLGFFERLRLDNVEKVIHLRLMMKETELKIAEKSSSIRKLRRNGAAFAMAAAKDRRFVMQINMLRGEIADVCKYRRNLVDELRSVRIIIAPGKVAEFLSDTLRKDDAEMA